MNIQNPFAAYGCAKTPNPSIEGMPKVAPFVHPSYQTFKATGLSIALWRCDLGVDYAGSLGTQAPTGAEFAPSWNYTIQIGYRMLSMSSDNPTDLLRRRAMQ
jgi:hypothetical protein